MTISNSPNQLPSRPSVRLLSNRRRIHVLSSPTTAFVLSYPTIGFYSLLALTSAASPDTSAGAIGIRAFALFTILFACVANWRRFSLVLPALIPAVLFLVIYSIRIAENVLFEGIVLPPNNTTALLIFVFSCIIPAFALAGTAIDFDDRELAILMLIFALIFVIGFYLNWEHFFTTAEHRASLERINSVALAYVASSFIIFLLIKFGESKLLTLMFFLLSPVFFLVVSLSRSRGMLASTAIALVIYFFLVRGGKRYALVVLLVFISLVLMFYSNGDYFVYITETVGRIGLNSDPERARLYAGAFNQIWESPLFGQYIVELDSGFYPHNIYVEAIMAVGLVGSIPFFVHVFIASVSAVRLVHSRKGTFVGTFVALLFFRDAIGAAAAGSIWGNAGFWISSFLVISMFRATRN